MIKELIKVVNGDAVKEHITTELVALNLIRRVGDKFLLKSEGIKVMSQGADDDISLNLSEYRKIFSGLRPGSMGDKRRVKDNLKWFMKETSFKYTMDDIADAAHYHIRTGGFHNDLAFIRQADYFIKKLLKSNGEQGIVSDLERVLEELEQGVDHTGESKYRLA